MIIFLCAPEHRLAHVLSRVLLHLFHVCFCYSPCFVYSQDRQSALLVPAAAGCQGPEAKEQGKALTLLIKTLVSLMSLPMSQLAAAARGPELRLKKSLHSQTQCYQASQRQQELEKCEPQQGAQRCPWDSRLGMPMLLFSITGVVLIMTRVIHRCC